MIAAVRPITVDMAIARPEIKGISPSRGLQKFYLTISISTGFVKKHTQGSYRLRRNSGLPLSDLRAEFTQNGKRRQRRVRIHLSKTENRT